MKKLSEFIGKNYEENQLKELNEFLSFENMKNDSQFDNYNGKAKISGFIFKPNFTHFLTGKIGKWKKYFSPELSDKFDEEIAKQLNYKIDFNYG